jgi:hypothetical protein
VLDVNGNWVKLRQLDIKDLQHVAYDEFLKTDGLPTFYDIRGNSIFLKAAPATGYVTMSGGLKIYIAREPYVFLATDAAREPGFDERFHRRLSLGGAFDFFLGKDQARADRFRIEMDRMDAKIISHYGGRNKDARTRIRRRAPRVI